MESAATVNSNAVALLLRGDNKSAIALLSETLSRMAESLDDLSQQKPTENDDDDEDMNVDTSQIIYVSPAVSPQEEDLEDSSSNDMFKCPFIFQIPSTPARPEGEAAADLQCAACSGVCLYNMALAYHVEATNRRTNSRSRLLKKAYFLYNKAYSVLEQCPLVPTDPLLILLMAICTNMSAIHLEDGELQLVKEWKSNLHMLFAFASPCELRCEEDHAAFRYFYLSILLHGESEIIAARAA